MIVKIGSDLVCWYRYYLKKYVEIKISESFFCIKECLKLIILYFKYN